MKRAALRPVPSVDLPRMTDSAALEPFHAQAQIVLDRFGTADPEFCEQIMAHRSQLEGGSDGRETIDEILAGLFRRQVPRDQVMACLLSWWMTLHKGREWIEQALDKAEKAGKPKQTRRPPAVADDGFIRTNEGRAVAGAYNLRHALKLLEVRLHFCELRGKHRIQIGDKPEGALNDEAVQDMKLLMEERFGMLFGKQYFGDTLFTIAREDRRHPVREYLSSLMWDDVPRIDRWLTTHLGVQESEYTNEVGLRVLLAAVARVMRPGCKFDQMLVLEGAQGVGKSTTLAALVPVAEWFTDSVRFAEEDRRFMESIAGRWIGEASELGGMGKRDVETLKAILSRQSDTARLAYAQTETERPRQCILIGTTNESVYLRDQTGNRRFWPVKVGTVDIEKLKTDRDQLWAEAVHRFKAGEAWTMREEFWATAAAEQADRAAGDPLQEALEDRLGEFTDARIPTSDIWTLLGMEQGRGKQADAARIGQAMKRLGWERAKMRFPERMGTVWGHRIGNGADILKVLKPASGEPSVIRDIPITP